MKVRTAFLMLATLLLVSTQGRGDGFEATRQLGKTRGDFNVPACAKYFVSAIWQFDAGPRLWSLSLTPTACTRSLNGATSSTGLIVDAVIRDHSSDQHWLDGNNAHGVRDQIICHLAQYPNKPTWNVEPGRPDVGYAETVRRECNP